MMAANEIIRQEHIQALRNALTAEMQRRGLTIEAYADGLDSGKPMRAVHVQELMNRLNRIRTAQYTENPIVANQTIIKKIHETDIDTLIKGLAAYPKQGGSTSCTSGCTGLCVNCTGSCTGGCTSCTGCTSCSGCSGSCIGGCYNGCEGNCQYCCSSCSGWCSSGCTAACNSGCNSTCTSSCYTGCSTSCFGGCANGCTGSSSAASVQLYPGQLGLYNRTTHLRPSWA